MEKIFYLAKDTTGQSQVAAALAKIKYPNATITETDGLDESAMAGLVSALTDDTIDEICICMPIGASHAAGKFTAAQAITLIPKLKTANQGTEVTGTAQSNSTKTIIKLAASGPSSTNDFYNLRLIATAGSTTVARLITDYTGDSKSAVVADTGTAITTTETYTIYMADHLHIIGETYQGSGTGNASYTAFKNLFPNAKQTPTIVFMMAGLAIYPKDSLTANSAASGSLTDSSEFSSGAYTGKDYYVFIESATTGGGQVRKIASNNTNVLTLSVPWAITPTGAIVYSIKEGANRILWDTYLAKAIPTYFQQNTSEAFSQMKRMMDQYGDLADGGPAGFEDEALIEFYAEKGKVICEALWAGIVS